MDDPAEEAHLHHRIGQVAVDESGVLRGQRIAFVPVGVVAVGQDRLDATGGDGRVEHVDRAACLGDPGCETPSHTSILARPTSPPPSIA